MAYEIRYTDFVNKGAIVVEDISINQDTSLAFPGKRSTAYGQSIAENFLHLLENFANTVAPQRPVEGQLWYNTSTGVDQLQIYDGTNWVPASGLKKSSSEPAASTSLNGDLWVDTRNQQLYLFNGINWILVGPEATGGELTGVRSDKIVDNTNLENTVFTIYVRDIPIIIVSSTEFTPRRTIAGFSVIKKGVNISRDYRYYGTIESAENLKVLGENIPAENFIRSDQEAVTTNRFSVRSDNGIRIGEASQLEILLNEQTVQLKQNVSGSGIDFVLRNQSRYNTVLHIDSEQAVGINNPAPEEALDIVGNAKISTAANDPTTGKLILDSTINSIDIDSGSIVTDGGIGVAQDVYVGGNVTVETSIIVGDIEPYVPSDQINLSGRGNIGTVTNKFNQIHVDTINAKNVLVSGNVVGTLEGTATSAERLINPISLTFSGGDIVGTTGNFDGSSAISDISLEIGNGFISSKEKITNVSLDDEILVNKTDISLGGQTGIYRVTKSDFIKTIPVMPVGSVIPYAGLEAPIGWLFCDGAEVKKSDFNKLWQVIGFSFKDPLLIDSGSNSSITHFAVPDMRGRLPLGIETMGVGIDLEKQSQGKVIEAARTLGNVGGNSFVEINPENLPEHEHNLQSQAGEQFYAIKNLAPENALVDSTELNYVSSTDQSTTQGLTSSGGLKTTENTGVPIDIMNPFMAINFIIYTGE